MYFFYIKLNQSKEFYPQLFSFVFEKNMKKVYKVFDILRLFQHFFVCMPAFIMKKISKMNSLPLKLLFQDFLLVEHPTWPHKNILLFRPTILLLDFINLYLCMLCVSVTVLFLISKSLGIYCYLRLSSHCSEMLEKLAFFLDIFNGALL